MHRFFTLLSLGAVSLLFSGAQKCRDCAAAESPSLIARWWSDPAPNPYCAECAPRSHIQIGANYTAVKITPEGLHSTFGNLGGLQARYEYKIPDKIYGGMTLAWRQGNTKGGGDERSLCYIDLQERLGYTFDMPDRQWGLECTLFSGLGYRHYGEKVTSAGSSSSVTCQYNDLYVPVGLLLDGRVSSTVSVGLSVEWMPQVYPTLKIDPLNGARWILTYKLANFRVAAPIVITPWEGRGWFFNVEPFAEYWQDGSTPARTETHVALGIPRNTYYFAGVNLNIGYSF